MKRTLQTATATGAAFLLSALPAFAADKIDLNAKGDFEPLGKLTPASVVSGLVSLTLVIAALVFFFILVIGGIRWIMSGGDKQATEGARGQITAALVGLVIVFSAWAILQLINALFGINILNLSIPSLKP
ncbi:hypothetical protein HY404_02515 [Candidatus Microgenomates bacterium]|nr:hypothetical protein [Candidatus Microgenomates bacterium]